MSDEKRIEIQDDHGPIAHVRGYHGHNGESEGVLAICAVTDRGPHYPETGRIIVGSPKQSPLIDGRLPNLGGFCCSPDAAEQLADALRSAAAAARKAMSEGR